MLCPKCRGTKIADNKQFRNVRARGLGHLAKNHPVAAGILGAIWLAGKAIDAASHQWKCETCGHAFSRTATGCSQCTATSATMYTTNCCQTRLCDQCLAAWGRTSLVTCTFCSKPVIRR